MLILVVNLKKIFHAVVIEKYQSGVTKSKLSGMPYMIVL